ncbi:hypothetical protein ENSA5_05790 [Enhygromyxa salina]|uniref:Uncharacterized protein n=1 Tax=Enhygromyxa salina TaxID=215803 RepID=A0A2S9YHS3_9BACT|nr:hypothetical protein [Enhygromyxa salina]PRQ04665.1 hypothetical protein ENSA5_05790 [Enhygromyxa salina]
MSDPSTEAPVELDAPAKGADAGPLHESLLHAAPARVERRASSRWAYPLWGVLVVSLFVLYHVSVLLVWNSPGKGLAKDFHKTFLKQVKGYEYFRGTRNNQSWAMFAPNPNRTNTFMRVFVEDQSGELWDFEQDIWGEDRYPYFWYDRRGKVNRRIDGKKHYQRIYGAWVCREWARQNNGEAAKSVTFVRRWTRVPKPQEVLAKKGGWNQWEAPHKQTEQETITCKTVVHGQLPNELRERYGLAPIDEEKEFRQVRTRTWWDKAERERERLEREAKRTQAREDSKNNKEAKTEPAGTEPTVKLDARGPLRDPKGDEARDQ